LRDEHKELFPQIGTLRSVADSIGQVAVTELRQGVDEAYAFLAHHLIPHAKAEEQALYPVVEKVMGAPEATATMRHDHVAVGELTQELAALRSRLTGPTLTASEANDLRRVLYGLYTLVRVHFAKEEEEYLPLLDARLTAEEAEHTFAAMHEAAHTDM
jgi:hemerythrin-like domain-containing protein